jgi:DNA-binding beta-propeller fold protein YncE
VADAVGHRVSASRQIQVRLAAGGDDHLPGGGNDALWVIDTLTNSVVGDPVDSTYDVPHNIALSPDGRSIYVTHSGLNGKVTIYAVSGGSPTPTPVGEVTVGTNPFGLAYVP